MDSVSDSAAGFGLVQNAQQFINANNHKDVRVEGIHEGQARKTFRNAAMQSSEELHTNQKRSACCLGTYQVSAVRAVVANYCWNRCLYTRGIPRRVLFVQRVKSQGEKSGREATSPHTGHEASFVKESAEMFDAITELGSRNGMCCQQKSRVASRELGVKWATIWEAPKGIAHLYLARISQKMYCKDKARWRRHAHHQTHVQ